MTIYPLTEIANTTMRVLLLAGSLGILSSTPAVAQEKGETQESGVSLRWQDHSPYTSLTARTPAKRWSASVRAPGQAVTVADALLAEQINHLKLKSHTFARRLESIDQIDLPIFIGTPEQIRIMVEGMQEYVPNSVGEALIFYDTDDKGFRRVTHSIVSVDLSVLKRWYQLAQFREERPDPTLLIEDVQLILLHELGAHLGTITPDRSLKLFCTDPSLTDLARDPKHQGCSVLEENRLRSEAGFPLRTAYNDPSAWRIGDFLDAESMMIATMMQHWARGYYDARFERIRSQATPQR